jgi:glycosyltransferase involved in cell wall biosynthesis
VKTKLKGIDFVYPNYSDKIYGVRIPKVYWIPDFQEVFLPHFFTESQRRWRRNHQLNMVKKADLIVFSSQDALGHFKKMYPAYENQTAVLPFAVTHPILDDLDFKKIKEKYELPSKFYFSPNQFWIHKNHITLLKALKTLKNKGEEIMIVFSGKEYDYRSPNYFDSLKTFVVENNLTNNVRFLGFIDRVDQLMILKNSLAVVQPSLFEGWSTVVEDAKAQNKFLILSNLGVHKEQLMDRDAIFFEAEDDRMLGEVLLKTWYDVPMESVQNRYHEDIERFGRKFLELTCFDLNI